MRSQLRVETLFSVHSAQYNIAHIAAWLTGYPIVVGVLNQLTDDLAHVTSEWQRVRLIATPEVAAAAEKLVLSLCAVLTSVDPGWLKPRARALHRKELLRAKQALTEASTAFDLSAKADAAPRRGDRRSASLAARGGESGTNGPQHDRLAVSQPVQRCKSGRLAFRDTSFSWGC